MRLKVNGVLLDVPAEWHDETLLDVLREPLGLVGSKFGCGAGLCGACTVLVDDQPVRSCLLPMRDLGAAAVTSIEGLAPAGELHPVQQAWLAPAVPQCGYCQAGQIMSRSASWWLMQTTTPVAEVGFLSGYADQPHFTRDFRQRVGITPLRYRSEFSATR